MNTQNQSEISIGVDVGKANLDIAIYPLDRYFRIPNTREAIQKFLPLLKELDVKRIVVEATGCVFRFVRPPVPVSSGQAFRCDPASMI
jgi:transposase